MGNQMRRYESRPQAAWVQGEDAYHNDYRPSSALSMTVFEQEPCERRTGLLDQRGHPIVSIKQIAPVGFNRSKE